MKILKLLLILTLILSGSYLKAQWAIKNIDTKAGTFNNKIKFYNSSVGFLMGSSSTILKTADGGETWRKIPLNHNLNIYDFQFINDSIIYAVGDKHIVASTDRGETWSLLSSFPNKQLLTTYFSTPREGLVAGYDGIYRTENAGSAWDTVWSTPSEGVKQIFELDFPTIQTGYAIGMSLNLKTVEQDNFILKTIDNGITWTKVKSFPSQLESVHFINNNLGFVGSVDGLVFKTTDGGISWTASQVVGRMSIRSIDFPSNSLGIAVGTPRGIIPEGSTYFFISRTINEGDTWEIIDTVGLPLYSVCFANDSTPFVSGSSSLVMKGGKNIKQFPANYPWPKATSTESPGSTDMESIIEIFPNPSDGIVYIKIQSLQPITKIALYDRMGQLVDVKLPSVIKENFDLNLTSLKEGIYLLQVQIGNKVKIQKFLKK